MKSNYGTLRILNPKTLEHWIMEGKYKNLTDKGYIYAYRCGRFRKEVCKCYRCRSPNAGKDRLKMLIKHNTKYYA